jgi:WD40 repeat protein
MRRTRSNVSHSPIAFMLLFAGLLVLLSAGSAFAQITYSLTVSSDPTGAVMQAGSTYPVGAQTGLTSGTPVTEIAPNSFVSGGQTYNFVQWVPAPNTSFPTYSPGDTTISGTVTANTTLVAQYAFNYTLIVNSTPFAGAQIGGPYGLKTNYAWGNLPSGTPITLIAPVTFVSGGTTYSFVQWSPPLPSGSSISTTTVANDTLAFSMPAAQTTIQVQYQVAPQCTVSAAVVTPPSAGTATPTTASSVTVGTVVTFTVTPGTLNGVPYQAFEYQVNGGAVTMMPLATDGVHLSTSLTLTVTANTTVTFILKPKFSLSIGNAGPKQPTFAPTTPNANRYVIAGTTSPATGFYQYQYLWGDTVPIAFASAKPDYKFGQDVIVNGSTMETQTTNPTVVTLPPTVPGVSDIYWAVNSTTLPAPANTPTSAALATTNGLPPQTCRVTMYNDTTVTAWWTRADHMTWVTQPTPIFGNAFAPLDTLASEGLSYIAGTADVGVRVKLWFEDNMPVAVITNEPTLTPGAGNPIIMDIAPETGKPGAILYSQSTQPSPTIPTPPGSSWAYVPNTATGVTTFGTLQIDRLGVGYQLQARYLMQRADNTGTVIAPTPTPTYADMAAAGADDAVPAINSNAFNIEPAEAGHFTWGYNYYGQLGIGLVTPPNPDPNQTGLPLQSFFPGQLSPANNAATPFGGSGHSGPVGLPGLYNAGHSAPPVDPPGNVQDIADEYSHFYDKIAPVLPFIGWSSPSTAPGSYFSEWWGRTYNYPDDTYAYGRDMLEPVQPYHQVYSHAGWPYVVGLPELAFNSVSTGRAHSLALSADGTLWAWGSNQYGQLGLGVSTGTYTTAAGTPAFADPQALTPPSQADTKNTSYNTIQDVISVAAGFDHTVALKGNGTVWTWGRNNDGQLGLGTTDDQAGGHPTPTQVPGLSNVLAVAAGDYFTLALERDGSVWAWGLNLDGQLGDGTQTNRSSPVQVMSSMLSRFVGHTDQVTWATMSPTYNLNYACYPVATASYDVSVKLWNPTTGALIQTMCNVGAYAHTGPINSVAFSPNGQYILTGSTDRTAKLWTVTGGYVRSFVDTTLYSGTNTTDAHQGSVTSVAFSTNDGGARIVTASVDQTAKVWNTSTGALISTVAPMNVTVTGANWTDATKTLTQTGAFAYYNWTSGGTNTIQITGGGAGDNVVPGVYTVASKVNNDSIILTTDITSPAGNVTDNSITGITTYLHGNNMGLNAAVFSPTSNYLYTGASAQTSLGVAAGSVKAWNPTQAPYAA